MTSIYELKLAQEKLEALQFLLTQVDELESAISEVNLDELRQIRAYINSAENAIKEIKPLIETMHDNVTQKHEDFNGKYEQIAPLITELKALKVEFDMVLEQGVINDSIENSTTQTYSVNKIKELFEAINQNISTVQNLKLDKNANAISASKLQTARTINGVAFDGTDNIVITDDTKLLLENYNTDKVKFATKDDLSTKLGVNEKANDSALVNGLTHSTQATPNTIVARDNNGDFKARHVTATHFNMTNAVQDNLATTTSEIMYRNNDDNYLRAMSLAKLKEVLGLANAFKNPLITGNIYVAGSVINTYGVTNIRPSATWQVLVKQGVNQRQHNVNYTNTTGYSIIVKGYGERTREGMTTRYYLELTGSNIRKIENGIWEVKPSGVYKTLQSIGIAEQIRFWEELR